MCHAGVPGSVSTAYVLVLGIPQSLEGSILG